MVVEEVETVAAGVVVEEDAVDITTTMVATVEGTHRKIIKGIRAQTHQLRNHQQTQANPSNHFRLKVV